MLSGLLKDLKDSHLDGGPFMANAMKWIISTQHCVKMDQPNQQCWVVSTQIAGLF